MAGVSERTIDLAGSILGTRVVRTEDPVLLTGGAKYLDDLDLPGKLHAVFARSESAHAALVAVHLDAAHDVPGVVAVYTVADLGVAPTTASPRSTRTSPARRWPTASCASSVRRSPSSWARPWPPPPTAQRPSGPSTSHCP